MKAKLTTEDLERISSQNPDGLDHLVGMPVQVLYIGLQGILVKDRQGSVTVRVRVPCGHRGCKKYKIGYLSGPTADGAWTSLCDINGKFIAYLRDQWFYCKKH